MFDNNFGKCGPILNIFSIVPLTNVRPIAYAQMSATTRGFKNFMFINNYYKVIEKQWKFCDSISFCRAML